MPLLFALLSFHSLPAASLSAALPAPAGVFAAPSMHVTLPLASQASCFIRIFPCTFSRTRTLFFVAQRILSHDLLRESLQSNRAREVNAQLDAAAEPDVTGAVLLRRAGSSSPCHSLVSCPTGKVPSA